MATNTTVILSQLLLINQLGNKDVLLCKEAARLIKHSLIGSRTRKNIFVQEDGVFHLCQLFFREDIDVVPFTLVCLATIFSIDVANVISLFFYHDGSRKHW